MVILVYQISAKQSRSAQINCNMQVMDTRNSAIASIYFALQYIQSLQINLLFQVVLFVQYEIQRQIQRPHNMMEESTILNLFDSITSNKTVRQKLENFSYYSQH